VRKITSSTGRDNRVATTLLALLLLSGCGGGDNTDQKTPESIGTTYRSTACPLVVTDQALASFYQLADRIDAGEEVDLEAMGQVLAQPIWDRWRRSFEPELVSAAQVARAFFVTLRSRDELPTRLRDKPNRLDYALNYRFHLERRADIEAYVADFKADDLACMVAELLDGWVDAAVLADTLRVDFVVGHPEIRLFEGHVMVDAGMAWASGRTQINRFIASTVYRQASLIEGRTPDVARGADILMQSLRLVCNEAIPAYLDEVDDIAFDNRHPALGHSSPKPSQYCDQARGTLRSLDADLTRTLLLPDPTDENWRQMYRIFVGAQSWLPTGWYMARVIADQFGEPRLREASRTVADFFATDQEAALMAPTAPSARAGSVEWHLQSARPFTPENAAWLDVELRRPFQSSLPGSD